MSETPPFSEEEDDGADELAQIRKRRQAERKIFEEEQRKERDEFEKRLAKERTKTPGAWHEVSFERSVI